MQCMHLFTTRPLCALHPLQILYFLLLNPNLHQTYQPDMVPMDLMTVQSWMVNSAATSVKTPGDGPLLIALDNDQVIGKTR